MAAKTPRIQFDSSVRDFVLTRDGYCCNGCQRSGPAAKLEIDHIIPLALGGTNDLTNLQTLCRPCNRQKRDRMDPRFRRRWT
jgi:5-methylcytosine-specific restriction protein A